MQRRSAPRMGLLAIYRRYRARWRNRRSRRLAVQGYASSFAQRRVVLIGPNCLLDDRDRERIAAADVCVVMNKGLRSAIYPEVERLARRVAYFHSLDLSERWGGGALDTRALRRAGFREVYYPLADPALARNVERFHSSNRGMLPLVQINEAVYADIQRALGGFRPTSGLAIIASLAPLPGCSLYVSGITFYRKAYMPDYAAHLQDLASIKAQLEGHGIHHPDREYLEFVRLRDAHGIQVDRQLEEILAVPYGPLFYTGPGDERLVPAAAAPANG